MKTRMIDLLLREPLGQIVAYNIIASLENSLLSKNSLKDFLLLCLDAFKEDEVASTEDLISQFEDVAREKRPINGRKKFFLLLCKRRTTSISDISIVSNIIELGVLKRNILKDSITTSGHSTLLSNPDPTDPAIEYAIEDLNNITDKYRLKAKFGGNPKRPIFWITPSIEKVMRANTSAKCADSVRDRLGLIHYEDNKILVEILIPGKVILEHGNARPTFIDAGANSRFRVTPDTIKAKNRSAWGCAVDLAKFANRSPKIDGLPERIVAPINCDKDLDIKFKYIGCTNSIRGNSLQDNDEAFAKRLNNSSSLGTLKQYILDLFL